MTIISVAIVAILAVIFFLIKSAKDEFDSIDMDMTSDNLVENVESLGQDEKDAEENIEEFDISAKPFEFSIKEIRVKKGDKVRINLSIESGIHDWVIDDFSSATSQLSAGQSGFVEFIADKTGVFEYYCSVGNHRQLGMVGKLIVEE